MFAYPFISLSSCACSSDEEIRNTFEVKGSLILLSLSAAQCLLNYLNYVICPSPPPTRYQMPLLSSPLTLPFYFNFTSPPPHPTFCILPLILDLNFVPRVNKDVCNDNNNDKKREN